MISLFISRSSADLMVVVIRLSSFRFGALDERAERGTCLTYASLTDWFPDPSRNPAAGIGWNQSAFRCVDSS
ncbi:hypothetical protein SPHINGOR109_50961 [Sphingorhabdus sp. 109]|nr:hypothetical protein SPHINGOR109_50961 [Sphingorhabdus sp. 109]